VTSRRFFEDVEWRGRLAAAAAVVTVLATYRERLAGRALAPLVGWTASAAEAVLEAVGIPTARYGGVIVSPGGFSYEIYFRCTGYLPAVLLTIAILVWPAAAWRKLVGIALGIPAVLLLNLFRLVHLFLVGLARPDIFAFAHGTLWEGVMVLGVLAFWWAWKKWATMSVSVTEGLIGGVPCPSATGAAISDVQGWG
jgi:exosortase/archaeosortase family protein